MTTVVLFIFGLIVGSFLNVVGIRWNSGISLNGRSFCNSCGKTLKWYELVPVISFLLQRGKCRRCKTRISIQYPLVELLTGLIFITLPYLLIPVFCIFVVITIYDLRHKIIPDILVYSSVLLSTVSRWFTGGEVLDWLAGPILFLFFVLLWMITRGRAIGFGDAKLVLSIGLLLGAAQGFSAIILAFWIGAATGLVYLFLSHTCALLRRGKKITMKSEIPFAPFLILGAWLSLIFEIDLLHVSLL